MKILFVHEVSWFKKVVYEMHDFPELLSLKGHEVHFLDYDEGTPRTRWRTITTLETRAHAGSCVAVTTPPRLLPGILGRLLATLVQPVVFLRLVTQVRPDIVVIYSVPTSGWQIAIACRAKRIPIIARVIDVPHALRETRYRRLVRMSERLVFSCVDFISTHNEALLKYCIDRGGLRENSSILYPGVDRSKFFPKAAKTNLQMSLGIQPADQVLIFMGTIFRFSGLFELLSELSPVLLANPSLKFLVVGDGEDLYRLRERVQTLQLEKQVILAGRIEYEDLPDYLRLGHVALLPFKQTVVTNGALPNKVLQYLACGIPTVATPLEGLTSMISEGDGVVYASNLSDFVRKAIQLANDSERRRVVSANGVGLIAKLCDWSSQVAKLEELLDQQIRKHL